MYKISRKNNGWLNCPRLVIFALFVSLITVTGCSNGNTLTPVKENGGSPLEKFTLANFPTTPPVWDIWVISDTTGVADEFSNLRTALLTAAGRKIKLVFPNIIAIPDHAFSSGIDIESLVSVSAPKAITIGERSFDNACSYLITIDLPQATTIGKYAFAGSFSLLEVNLPQATTIGDDAFWGCGDLITVDLPNATTIGDAAFTACHNLTRVLIATDSTLGPIGKSVFTKGIVSNITVITSEANVPVFKKYETDNSVTFADIRTP